MKDWNKLVCRINEMTKSVDDMFQVKSKLEAERIELCLKAITQGTSEFNEKIMTLGSSISELSSKTREVYAKRRAYRQELYDAVPGLKLKSDDFKSKSKVNSKRGKPSEKDKLMDRYVRITMKGEPFTLTNLAAWYAMEKAYYQKPDDDNDKQEQNYRQYKYRMKKQLAEWIKEGKLTPAPGSTDRYVWSVK